MTSMQMTLGLLGFGAAAVAFAVLAIMLRLSDRLQESKSWLLLALLVSCACTGLSGYTTWGGTSPSAWQPSLDALRAGSWALFVTSLLRQSATEAFAMGLRRSLIAAALVVAAAIALMTFAGGIGIGTRYIATIMLLVPSVGLAGLHYAYRSTHGDLRFTSRTVCIAVAMIFTGDILVYADALLFGQLALATWMFQGLSNAVAAPFLLVAINERPQWTSQLFVSRQVVLYAATLVAAASFTMLLAGVAYFIGGNLSNTGASLQASLLAIAAGVIFYATLATTASRRLKVFVAKHFFRNRYDYREVWLRLSQTLAGHSEEASLPDRSVKALAAIIGSSCGELWLASGSPRTFEGHGSWGTARPQAILGPDSALVQFLEKTLWVIDTKEYLDDPDRYANAFASDQRYISEPSIVVPLVHRNELIGIVRLDRPPGLGILSFEDHDLLKTAGQQVAIFLVHARSQEELSETRQFEAFSRLTAFLMHDLKNMITQQELVVGNAKRFKHRPEFIDDAIRTMEASVQRMKRVLERLQKDSRMEKSSFIDLPELLNEVCHACADRNPVPRLTNMESRAWVTMDRDRLGMALTHAVRNAQDATSADGRIELKLSTIDDVAIIEVVDDGGGMDQAFIRERLFKPFDSTKGAKGMGIGAYQIRETLKMANGDVSVTSEPGTGTTVAMRIPLATKAGDYDQDSVA